MTDDERAQLTLLLVDDESENVRAYARALRGYTLIEASRGDEALAKIAEHAIDIVVTDQRMPGSSGAQLLQRARAVNPIVRRIVVSATAQPEHLLEAINRGEVERYLVKPVEPDRLRAAVDELAVEYLRMQAQKQRLVELQDQLYALRREGSGPREAELLERVELEVVRARRYRRPLTFLVFETAPEVPLVRMRSRLREIDIALPVGARLVIALPECDRAAAEAVWDRLRPVIGGPPPLLRACPEDGDSLQTLLLVASAP